jgi:hypothetical protein
MRYLWTSPEALFFAVLATLNAVPEMTLALRAVSRSQRTTKVCADRLSVGMDANHQASSRGVAVNFPNRGGDKLRAKTQARQESAG